jgi:Fe-S-cluster-containing hydrogenase component 2
LPATSRTGALEGGGMNRFVLADPSRCIGCYACVAGCVESHRKVGRQAYPRLYILHASPAGTLPVQCHHCEEPACAAVCPVNAITRRDDAVYLNESLCIGCKLCALACPFGAIIPGGTPLPRLDFSAGQYTYIHTPYQADPMFLRELAVRERLSLLNWESGQKTVAVKCDLCDFREEGPACVSACPHRALRLVTEPDDCPPGVVERAKAVVMPAAKEG